MYLRFPIFKLHFSSSPKLYLLHFKKLFWCLLNVSLCHNNFAKLHCSHMTLNPFEFFLKHKKTMSTTVSQNFSSFDFINWKILLLPWSHLKLGPEHKMTYNLLLETSNSLKFWETHKIYVFYICSKFQLYWWWSQRVITFKINWLQNWDWNFRYLNLSQYISKWLEIFLTYIVLYDL
jgi:hypothetical protein